MNDDLKARLREDPLVQEFAENARHYGEARQFFENLDGSPCPEFIAAIRHGYPQRGGTVPASPELIATVVIQLAFDRAPQRSLRHLLRAWLRLTR